MISADQFTLLKSNLAKTYFGIAAGIEGTVSVSSSGFEAATNDFAHPICNFAVCEDSDALDLPQLRQVAASRKYLNVYVPHFNTDDFAHRSLEAAGFRRLYTLVQMAWTGEIVMVNSLKLAANSEQRFRTAEFMADQFFTSQTYEVRNRIARATLHLPEFELYEMDVYSRAGIAGAVLLHPTERVLGLYNLCVAFGFRSQGYGSAIVCDAQALSQKRDLMLGLQCDPKLLRWYQHLGLARVGSVDVYEFDKR